MTTQGVARHFPEFFESIALGGDGMTQGGGDEAAFHLILTHFKDDFIHGGNIAQARASRSDGLWVVAAWTLRRACQPEPPIPAETAGTGFSQASMPCLVRRRSISSESAPQRV